jgi:hypothetical protein
MTTRVRASAVRKRSPVSRPRRGAKVAFMVLGLAQAAQDLSRREPMTVQRCIFRSRHEGTI